MATHHILADIWIAVAMTFVFAGGADHFYAMMAERKIG